MEDLFRSYGLDGVQWGAERMGPLMNVISPWNDNPLTCFCEYCKAREEMRVDLLRTVGRAFHDATGSR